MINWSYIFSVFTVFHLKTITLILDALKYFTNNNNKRQRLHFLIACLTQYLTPAKWRFRWNSNWIVPIKLGHDWPTYLRKNLTEFQEGVTNADMFSYSSISLCIEPTSHALDRLHLPYSFCPERIAQVKYRLPMIEESFEVEEEVSLHPLIHYKNIHWGFFLSRKFIQWLVSSEIYTGKTKGKPQIWVLSITLFSIESLNYIFHQLGPNHI